MFHNAKTTLGGLFRKPPFYIFLGMALLYLLAVVFVPRGGYDNGFWFSWAGEIADSNLAIIYHDPRVNNNPLILFALWLFSRFFETPAAIAENIHLFKAAPLLFDFLTIALILRVLAWNKNDQQKVFFVVGNIAFWYNSVIWGQVDSVYTFFVAISLTAAMKKHAALTAVLFVLAINVKLQAAIIAPILLVCLFPIFRKRIMTIFAGLVGAITTQAIILLPFILGGTLPETIHALLTRSVDFYPFASVSGYNLWHLVLSGDPAGISDATIFWGSSYRTWGLLLFTFSLAGILAPMVICQLRKNILTPQLLTLTSGLAFLAFFFFNTQMHERYAHPVILFFGIFALLSRAFGPYILVSVAYVLNLESVMRNASALGLERIYDGILFSPRFVALLYAVAAVWSIVLLYREITPTRQPSTRSLITTSAA